MCVNGSKTWKSALMMTAFDCITTYNRIGMRRVAFVATAKKTKYDG